MAYDPTEIDALRARLGWTTPEEEEGLWDTLTQPIKGLLGAEANVGGQIAGLLAPQAYEEAVQEMQRDLGVNAQSSLLERAEALPGLGDVGAQLIPDEIREGWLGTALGPLARMGGNILGSPTTYTPFVLGKVGTAIAKGIPAAEAAVTAMRGAKTAQQAAEAQKAFQAAVQGAGAMRQAGVWAYRNRMPIDKAMALGGLAYAPEIVEGVGQSASEAWRLAQEQKYGDAVATGVGGAFLAGLAGLMGKGALDGIRATGHLKQWLAENHPDIARAAEAAEAGEIPPGALDQAEQAVGQMAMFPGVEPTPIRGPQLEPEQMGLDLSQQMEMLGGPEGLRLGSPRMEPGIDVMPQAGGAGQLGLFDEQGRRMAQGEPMLFPDLEGPRPLPGPEVPGAELSARAAAGPEQLALFGPKGGIGKNVVRETPQVSATTDTKGLGTEAVEPVSPAPTPEVQALPEVPATALTAAQKAFAGGKGKAHHKQAAATRALMQAGVAPEDAKKISKAIREASDRGEKIAPEEAEPVLTDEQAASELEAAAEEPGYVTDPDPRAVQLYDELSTTERVENPDGTVDYIREGKKLSPEDAQRQADTFTSLPKEDQEWLARELGAKPDDVVSELQAPAAAVPPTKPPAPAGGGEPPAPRPEPPAAQPTKGARYVGEQKYGPEKMAEYAETRALEIEYQRLTEEERVKPGQQPAQRRRVQLLEQELSRREDVPADAFEFVPEPEVKDWEEPLRQPPRPKREKKAKRQPFEKIEKGMRRSEDLVAVWDEAEQSTKNKSESAQTLTRSFNDPDVAGHLVKADEVRRRLPEGAAKAHQDAVRKLLLDYGQDPKMQQDLILAVRKLNEDVDFVRQMHNRRAALDDLTDESLEALQADYARFKEIQGHDEWKALNKKRRLAGEEKKANPLTPQEEELIKEYERLKKSVSRKGGESQLMFEIGRLGRIFGSKGMRDIKLSLQNFEAGKFDKLVDAAVAAVDQARKAGEKALPEDVEIKLGNALRRAQDQVTSESRYAEEFRDILQERAAKMARDLQRNPEIEWNGETVRLQDLSEVDLIKKLMASKTDKETLDRMRRLRREQGLEVEEGGETRLAAELTDEQMARVLAKDLQTEGSTVAPPPKKPAPTTSPNAEAIADLPAGRLRGGQGKTAWQITRRQLERYDLAATPVERGGMGLKGEELQEFVLERRPSGGDRNLVGKNVGTGKVGAVWKKFIRGEEGDLPKFAGEWDAKVGKFLDEFDNLSDVKVDDEIRSQLHSIYKSFLSSRAAEEIKPGQKQFKLPNMARLKKALQDMGVSIADNDGRPRVMERLAEYLDPSGKLKDELLGVAGAVRKSAGKEAVLSERLGQLESHGVRTIGGRKVSNWGTTGDQVRFEAVEKSRGQEIHLSGTKGDPKTALRQFVETQREKGLKKIMIGPDEFTPEVRDAMQNMRRAGLVDMPEPPTFMPGPDGISRDTRVYEVKPPVKMGSSVTTPKLSGRHAELHARLDSTMMDNAHLIEGLAESLPQQFRRRGSTVLEDAKRVVLSAVRSMALGRSMFHGRQPVTELSFRDAKAGGLTVLSPEVLKQKGVVKVGDRYFRHDPLRTLIRSVFFKPDADIFGELRGAGHALQKAQQAARVVRDTDPVMVSRGSFNGTWDIGADASGQRYVIKVSTLDDHLRMVEDSVSGLGEIMAPVVRSGITPEGLTWRVEKLGSPVAVRDVEGVTIYPRSLSPAQQVALAAADAKVRDLAAKGKVMLSSSYGPHQFAFIDGKPRLVDRNSVIPTSQRRKIDRYVAQLMTNEKVDLDLTPRERFLRESQYEAAIRDGHKLESGVVANFDVDYGKEVTSRLAGAIGPAGARSLSRITKAISDLAGAQAEFGGVTMSPYLRGQYVNGKVFVNLVEELEANGGDVAGAARQGVFSLIHEIVHDMVDDAGHGSVFRTAHEDLLLKLEGKVDKWADELTEALDHDELAGLLPYYKEASLNGGIGRENWRDAEGVGGVPPRTPEGGAPGAADRRLAGEAGAEADRGAGLRPGEAVQEGGRRTTGQLGRASPFGRGDGGTADTSSYVTQRDRQAGGRLASRSAGPRTIDEGIALVRELTDVKGITAEDAAKTAVSTAFQIARRMQKADPEAFKDILIKPSPRGKGEVWARFNMENVEGLSDTTRGAIKIWSDITRDNPKLSRMFDADKVRTWDELDDEVRKLIGANSRQDLLKMLGNKKGLTDSEVVLARMLGTDLIRGVQEAERDMVAAQLGRAKGDVTGGQLESAMQRYNFALDNFAVNMEKVINPVTGVGRALAAAKKVARSLDPQMAMWQDMRAGLLERLKPRYKDFDELTRVVDHLMAIAADGFNRGDLEKFADEFRRAMKFSMFDKLLEAFKAGLLGWKSRAANIASNSLVQGVRELERNVANAMENIVSKAKGEVAESSMSEFKLNSMVLSHWKRTAIPEWARSQKDAFMLKPEDYNNLMKFGTLAEDFNIVVGAIPGKFGEFVRFTLKGMNAEDALFKKMSQLQYYYRQIHRNLRHGVEGFNRLPGESLEAATARIVQDLENYSLQMEAGQQVPRSVARKFAPMREEGIRIAREETFQKDLPPVLKSIVQGMATGHGRWAQLIFPFVRTPWNIAVETVKRTPLGLLDVASKWDGLSRMERMDALSRPMVGTAIGAAVYLAAMENRFTGGGPIDPEAEANKRLTGWQPYSIKTKNGWVSYQRLEPMSSIMGMAADLAEGVKEGDFSEGQFRSGMVRLLGSVTENLTNKTFLSGLEGLVTALSDPIRYGERWVKQQQGAWIPNTFGPIPFGHLAQAVDDTYRQTDAFTMSPFIAKIPFASKALEPQLTPTGEERKRPGSAVGRLLSPTLGSAERRDYVAVAAELMDDIGAPPVPPKRYTYVKGVRVWFTPEERRVLAQAQQNATKFIGARLARDPNFMRLPDNEDVAPLGAKTKKDVIKGIYNNFRKQAMATINARLIKRAAGHTGGEARL